MYDTFEHYTTIVVHLKYGCILRIENIPNTVDFIWRASSRTLNEA